MTTRQFTRQQWLDEMTLELRLLDVGGEAIGDAIAAVETHCADSGEEPIDAFGDPREYARALEFAPSQLSDATTHGWVTVLSPVAAGMVGIALVPGLVRAIVAKTDVEVAWGELAALGALAVIVLLTIRFMQPLVQDKRIGIPALAVAVTLMALLPTLFTAVTFTLPVWGAAILALGLLAGSVAGMHWQRHALDDPIVDPRSHRRTSPALSVLTIWLFPILAAFLALMTAIPLWFAQR